MKIIVPILLPIWLVSCNVVFAQPNTNALKNHPDYYVYHDALDTIFLTKIYVGQSFPINRSTSIVDSIQIDGKGPKEIIFYREYAGGNSFIMQASQGDEKTQIGKYEIWNIETKVLLFEAINSYEFRYDNWNMHSGKSSGTCLYHYDFNIDSTGLIGIDNFKEIKTDNNCKVDKSVGIYKYENDGYRFYAEKELIKERPQNDNSSWTESDSIKQVSRYEPLDTYLYVWKNGKCGLVVNQRLIIPANFSKDDFIFSDGMIAITAHGEALTLINPIDSVFYRVTTTTGDVLNHDSLHTSFTIHDQNDGSTYVEVLREYYNFHDAHSSFPDPINHPWGTCNEIYIINKNTGKTTAIYNDINSAYIPFGGLVISLTPTNKKMKNYRVQVYSKYTAKLICSYTWSYNADSLMESEDIEYQNEMYYKLWYYDERKSEEILIGYLKWNDYLFYKKLE